MEAAAPHTRRTGWTGTAETVITTWAILGGVMVLAVVLMNVWSVVSAFGIWETLLPHADITFQGDFELTQMGIAIAAFAFLPYCQLVGANVSADIFTAGASRRVIAFFTLLGSLVALVFALLLIWRMYYGMLDQKNYDYTTTILQIPHWMAFVPILISLALLALAALVTLLQDMTALSRGHH